MGDTFLKGKITNLNFQEEKKRSLPIVLQFPKILPVQIARL